VTVYQKELARCVIDQVTGTRVVIETTLTA